MIHFFLKKTFLLGIWAHRAISYLRLNYLHLVFGQRFTFYNTPNWGKQNFVQLDWSNSAIQLGANFQLRNYCTIRAEQGGKIEIGDNVFINNYCSLNALMSIKIGDNCMFGEGVKIYDHNHAYTENEKTYSSQGYNKAAINIGKNCWLASHVIILKGVTIGDNAVVGAGCIIYKDVAPGTVIIGKQ